MTIEVKKLVLRKTTTSLMLWFSDVKHTKFMFFIYFIATQKKKIMLGKNWIVKRKRFICKISIIIILIYQKLESVGSTQQKIKLPSPQLNISMKVSLGKCFLDLTQSFWGFSKFFLSLFPHTLFPWYFTS